jgi:protoheme IX farnesyltransferase
VTATVPLPVSGRLRAFVRLTKPRVIELLLVTTVPAMILADGGVPPLGTIAAVLVGGTMSAGGANTVNCWLERDRDRVMGRTSDRPLPSGDLPPNQALAFGIALEVGAFALLAVAVNLLSACLAVGAALFYIFVYTIWLKPRSTQNIVIGGAAGSAPVLVGWAAVTGRVGLPALVMFAIVFFWTPPHFWALAVRYSDDYAAAGIPMLPVVKGVPAAVRQMVLYTVVVVGTSLALAAVSDLGIVYLVGAVVLGAVFLGRALQLGRNATASRAIRFFTLSNLYLALLFAAIAVDTLVRAA